MKTIPDEMQLYNAIAGGDVAHLTRLLRIDPTLLERVSYTSCNNTPLHIATMKGDEPFVRQILSLSSHLAKLVNSQLESPLHVASAKGEVAIAKLLMDAAPEMCFARDRQGRTPLHIATLSCTKNVELLNEILLRAPAAGKEKLDGGLTVLHLSSKYGKIYSLKFLLPKLKDLKGVKNDHGETMMDMLSEQQEMIDYVETIFPMQLIPQQSLLSPRNNIPEPQESVTQHSLTTKREVLMVVAVVIASMAIKIGVNPPGGCWQDDDVHLGHRAGEAILATKYPHHYQIFTIINSICGISSLCLIPLLINEESYKHKPFRCFVMIAMWLVVATIGFNYLYAALMVNPYLTRSKLTFAIVCTSCVWCLLIAIVFLLHFSCVRRCLAKIGVIIWNSVSYIGIRISEQIVKIQNSVPFITGWEAMNTHG